MFPSANALYTERGIPSTLFPTKTKVIVPGIVQEQMQVIQSNAIPSPTPGGTEIQIFLPQLINTWLDCQSFYLCFHAVVQWSYTAYPANDWGYANHLNGALLGSFYSVFYRLTVYANSVNVTDDIIEVGIVGCRMLMLSMTKTARECQAWALGFHPSPQNNMALAGYRARGCFPESADVDNLVLQNDLPAGQANPIGITGVGIGNGGAATQYINQQFDFAVPMLGSLGINNEHMYYMGLGNTRISLFTENPANFWMLPPLNNIIKYIPTATTPTVQNANFWFGGLIQNGWAITRVRAEYNIVRVDQGIMNELMAMISGTGGAIVTRCISFQTSTQQIQQGASGTFQPQLNIRRGCVKSCLVLFNNTGQNNITSSGAYNNLYAGTNIAGQAGSNEYVNMFNKYGSINPGLGANTMFLINNVSYPKLGLNPTQFPGETWAYILESLNLLTSDHIKPAIVTQNWLVADPIVAQYSAGTLGAAAGALTTGTTNFWRIGTYTQGGLAWSAALPPVVNNTANANTQAQNANCTIYPWYAWALQSAKDLITPASFPGMEDFVMSNDFFMYFSFEDTPRPGLLSGKNTMDGSNYLNIPLVTTTSYLYNIYFVVLFDALIVHEIASSNVYMIS